MFLKNVNPEIAATIKPKQIKSIKSLDSLLTENEITAMLNAATNLRDKALLACLYDSGARKSELLSTKIKDAKFDSYGCQLWLSESKTYARNARLVFAASYLKQWLDAHPNKENKDGYIFCSSRAPYNVIGKSGIYDILRFTAKRAGITKAVNPHMWRYTKATDLATKITEQEMKVVLGWAAGSSIASTYVHLSGDAINKAMFKANNLEIEEDNEPSLLSNERCPRCREINDRNRDTCFKCGLPLCEKVRLEELENERKAEEEKIQALKSELMKEILEALATNETKKIEFSREPLTEDQIDTLNKPENQILDISIPSGLHDLEISPDEIPEEESVIVERIFNKKSSRVTS